jgi:competence ComEA-like helix-hairpin-helix protein
MDEKIDINRADVEALASLPGIGRKRAAQIVEYRTAVHRFEEVIELTAVPGISERMVREIAEHITVNGASLEETADSVEGVAVIEPGMNGEEPVGAEVPVDLPDSPEAEVVEETADPEEGLLAGVVEGDEPDEDEIPVTIAMPEAAAERLEAGWEPEAADSTPPEIVERRVVETVQRRHFHVWQQFFGVAAGALLGSILTLLMLYLLNGTLRFAGESRATGLQLQLDEETSAIRQSQGNMADEMGELTGRVTELDNELAVSEEAIGVVEENVGALEEETAALGEQIETIHLTAEKFDAFLTGLRDLLVTLQGVPPVPTATTTITATSPAGTITITVTPETTAVTPTATAASPEAGSPTRTPRPTATPFIEIGDD